MQLQVLHIVLSYNLTNTINLPTRVTKNTSSLIDVMIMNEQYINNSLEVVNLGYSDHFAQISCVLVDKQNNRMENITKRNFSRRNIGKLITGRDLINYLSDKNKLFLNKFIYYVESAFLQKHYEKEAKTSRWITKGIKVSHQRMRFFNNLKTNLTLSSEVLNYIIRYHLILVAKAGTMWARNGRLILPRRRLP